MRTFQPLCERLPATHVRDAIVDDVTVDAGCEARSSTARRRRAARDQEVVRRQGGAARRRPDRPCRRARRHLRPVRLGQVDAAAHDQPARGAERGLGPGARRRVRARAAGGDKEKRGGPLQLRRHVGMVFQQFNLFPHLTALDNIARPLRSAKGSRRDGVGAGRGASRCSRSGLLDWAAHYPGAALRRSGSSASRSPVRSASTRR